MRELPKGDGESKGAPAKAEDKMQGVMSQKRAEMRKTRKKKKVKPKAKKPKKQRMIGNHAVLNDAERKEMLKQRYLVKPPMHSDLKREIDEDPWCALDNDAIWS